jgi:hypothetical protein
MPSDAGFFREQARDFALKSQQAKDHVESRTMKALAQSYVLLEVHATWLASTDIFLDAVKNNRPWPAPDVLSTEARAPGAE